MALNPRSTAVDTAAAPPTFFDPGATNAAIEAWLRMQQQQLDTLIAWQHSLSDMQQDLWDQWVSHWGGGVPLDG